MPPELESLVVADPPEAWEAAGFSVDPDGTCRIGVVRVRLTGRDGDVKGIQSWALRGMGGGVAGGAVEGLPTGDTAEAAASPADHPNGALAIDHVVLLSPDVDRSIEAFSALGLEPRRERETDSYGAPMRQVFFRLGEPILELVGLKDPQGDGPARFFGLAITVRDLDAARASLGENIGEAKDAVQDGRRIATLRHKQLGMTVAVALMSPEPV